MKEFNAAKPYIRAGIALLCFLFRRADVHEVHNAFVRADEFIERIELELQEHE